MLYGAFQKLLLGTCCICFLCSLGHGYILRDDTIHRHYLSTCRKLTRHPTLWQVAHESPSGKFSTIRYELTVGFDNKGIPRLTLWFDGNVFRVSYRRERLARVLGFVPLYRAEQLKEAPVQRLVMNRRFGTFDLFSTFPRDSEVIKRLFRGLGRQVSSGRLRVLNDGIPSWIFGDVVDDPGHSQLSRERSGEGWVLMMKQAVFFPAAVRWRDASGRIDTWQFEGSQEYHTWGPGETELSKISLVTVREPSGPLQTNETRSSWKLLKTFEDANKMKRWWKNKRKMVASRQSGDKPPLGSVDMQNSETIQRILEAY